MSEATHCRLCAEVKPCLDVVNVTQDISLKQKISFCFQLEIEPEDVLPTAICTKCSENAAATYEFTQKIEQSQQILCAIYKQNKIKLELGETTENTVLGIDYDDPFEVDEKPEYWSDDNNDGLDDVEDDDEDWNEPLSSIKEQNDSKSKIKCELKLEDNKEPSNRGKRRKSEEEWKDYKFSCTLCENQSTNVQDLRQHYKTKHDDKPIEFKCMDCSHTSSKYQLFKRHVQKHRNKFKYWCEICNKFFHLKFRYQTHMKHVHGPNDNQKSVCPICGKSFKWPSSLDNHKRYVHIPADKKYLFECEICHKKVSSASNLTIHKKVHQDAREHTCEHCGLAFKQQGNLKQHIIHKHIDVKDLQLVECPSCPKVFKTSYSLKRHERVHYVGEMFKCEQCLREFRHKRALQRHEKIHTGDLPFECEYCQKRFRGKSDLHIHLRQHTGERPYSCLECNHHFSNNSNFIKHLKGRHGLKNFSIANQRQYPFLNDVIPL